MNENLFQDISAEECAGRFTQDDWSTHVPHMPAGGEGTLTAPLVGASGQDLGRWEWFPRQGWFSVIPLLHRIYGFRASFSYIPTLLAVFPCQEVEAAWDQVLLWSLYFLKEALEISTPWATVPESDSRWVHLLYGAWKDMLTGMRESVVAAGEFQTFQCWRRVLRSSRPEDWSPGHMNPYQQHCSRLSIPKASGIYPTGLWQDNIITLYFLNTHF